jgi:hypothetical protein
MVSPEQCCAYFSMIAAEQRLKVRIHFRCRSKVLGDPHLLPREVISLLTSARLSLALISPTFSFHPSIFRPARPLLIFHRFSLNTALAHLFFYHLA